MGTPFDVSGNIENQASRHSMGIQLAIGAHDAAFRGGYLSPCMDHLALGAYQWHAVVERARHVHLQFERGETFTRR